MGNSYDSDMACDVGGAGLALLWYLILNHFFFPGIAEEERGWWFGLVDVGVFFGVCVGCCFVCWVVVGFWWCWVFFLLFVFVLCGCFFPLQT